MLLAYIDPAIGSMLLQALAGIFLAAMVMGRRIFFAPLEWLHLKTPRRGSDGESHELAELPADQ
jgi:hypothetical protein